MSVHRHLILLGPQPEFASLKTALATIQPNGPIALITAGWQTEEPEDGALKQAIGRDCFNLELFARTEQLFVEDPELIQLLKDRQDELRHLRDAYNERLNFLLKSARHVLRRHDSLIDLTPEKHSAIAMVRQLDREYFLRTCQVIDDYDRRLQIPDRPLVAAHRHQIHELLNRAGALVISGGHVAIILNRLKIFGILEAAQELPIIAWSGGVMALADQIVFFHDSPPQGAGDPELLRAGMGLFHEWLPLPDARHRLNLEDEARIELFARRFEPYRCVIFDEQTMLERRDGIWNADMTCLGNDGQIVEMSA